MFGRRVGEWAEAAYFSFAFRAASSTGSTLSSLDAFVLVSYLDDWEQ